MLKDFIIQKTLAHFPFAPTGEQHKLICELANFVTSHDSNALFLMRGYAGTGKTSVISALIKLHDELKQPVVLLAPTGRAAKVLAAHANKKAYTIHKKIYRKKSISEPAFQLDRNIHTHTLFVVDEASMISNSGGENTVFGNGRLLDDLINFVYSSEGCRLLLIGDDAQLPPVMQDFSPALEKTKLQSYNLTVSEFQLTESLRQSRESGILTNATSLRKQLQAHAISHPKFNPANFTDIECITGDLLIEKIENEYRNGIENTIIITRSNKRANIYNQGIRAKILQREDEITSGDMLMVLKNNYSYGDEYPDVGFVANGDIAQVQRVIRYKELYGFRFADLIISLLDYDVEMEVHILVDALHADTPAAMKEMNDRLFDAVAEDYADIKNKRTRMKMIFENEYYNALQVKFAYAITCHKAQGGEWDTVFVDYGAISTEQIATVDYYRWLYTALTRAAKKLYLVNFPETFF